MNNIQIFNNPDFGEIRTVVINGEPWFVGKDVAVALGYDDTVNALKKHVDSEDKIMGCQNATPSIIDSMGRIQYPTWINESGIYTLIFGSKLESAKRFKHWVTSEVLPAIRRTGRYTLGASVKFSKEEAMEILRIISSCDDAERSSCISFVLHNTDMGTHQKATRPHRPYQGSESVAGFIPTTEIAGRPTADVYAEYKAYCNDNGIEPLNHITFSKTVTQMSESEIIYKKISGKTRRVFAP